MHSPSTPDNTMLQGAVIPTFFRYSVPWALGFLLLSSAGLVDAIFIGRYAGALALAAVNLIMPVMSLFFGLGVLLSVGGAVRCARYTGQGKHYAANAIFTKTLVVLLFLSVVICVLLYAAAPSFLALLGAQDDLVPLGVTYLRTVLLFGPLMPLSYALSHFVRVARKPALASLGLTLSAAVNVVLDYIFIAELNMGVFGAALATGIGYSSSGLLFFLYFLQPKANLNFVKVRNTIKSWMEVFHAGLNGGAEFVNEMSVGTVMMLLNLIMLERLGPMGVAAFTVVNYGSWFALTMSFGVSDTLAPLISANTGARQHRRVAQFFRVGLVTLFGLGLLVFLLFTLFPNQLAALFLPNDPAVALLATEFMGVYKWGFLFAGMTMGFVCYFTGLQRPPLAIAISLSRSLIFPVLFLLLLPRLWGNFGVFAAIPMAEACTFTLAVLLWRRHNRTQPQHNL